MVTMSMPGTISVQTTQVTARDPQPEICPDPTPHLILMDWLPAVNMTWHLKHSVQMSAAAQTMSFAHVIFTLPTFYSKI